jgi:hypothetical protein
MLILRAEGLSCSLCVLYGGLSTVSCNFRSKKYKKKFFSSKFLSIFWVIKSLDSELDPVPKLEKNAALITLNLFKLYGAARGGLKPSHQRRRNDGGGGKRPPIRRINAAVWPPRPQSS